MTGNVYLHAQIFTGLMYVAASLCMWFLRAWKISQIEDIALAEAKSVTEVEAVSTKPDNPRSTSTPSGLFGSISSDLRRLLKRGKV